ncbi:MAG: hypothetical protein HXY43_05085 [Fischerella sp.]|jgi:hypothetical protein|uniref:hypothetical protein n=1 Tax=Fischerella sp. TaxID=1191 RepID=UPI00180C199C|nr:hypothetical protein [Fischerella sp.]NWF58689.1 hypothetical protein [Fischerella sp.]
MIICDLDLCEAVEFDNKIVGGAMTYTYADTDTSPTYADAEAGAIAFGDVTGALSETETTVRNNPGITTSIARANAVAWAWDENGFSMSRSTSVKINVNSKN